MHFELNFDVNFCANFIPRYFCPENSKLILSASGKNIIMKDLFTDLSDTHFQVIDISITTTWQ